VLQLVHGHLAGVPVAPALADASIPQPLSDIVIKLLAKAPEERYQTAEGLAADLRHCATQWSAQAHIAPFALARRDASGQLVRAAKLYGRDAEVQALLETFARCCEAPAGRGTMVLVEGYAGIGKTALIQQLVRPIVRRKGLFIRGKFDQVVRDVPFGALLQAFRGLVQQLLTQDEARLASWRTALMSALGGNGGVLAEVIPEIAFIIGAQPAPAALGATEAQNRFQRVLQQFLAALAQPAHPLVLFLDDLQWADAATLDLLEPLLGGGVRGLLLIGALRELEPDATPRLTRTLAALERAGVTLQRLRLAALGSDDMVQLVADALRCTPERAAPLAALVQRKTGGNPFFVDQFLHELQRQGQLRFDAAAASWLWRIDDIAGAPLADNVIELMTHSIRQLPPKSQYVLTLAACIGNRFERDTLAIISEQSAAATAADLAPALAAGLVLAVGMEGAADAAAMADDAAAFTFLHDRVQQAAYALIPAERRRMLHLTVGRLLRARSAPGQWDAQGFDVLHHLNLGRELIVDDDERRQLALLNLAGARRAKASTANDAALGLLRCGLELLDDDAWTGEPALGFELLFEAAECRYLCGEFDAAERDFETLLQRARTPLQRARVLRLRALQQENRALYAASIASRREGLALCGLHLPADAAKTLAALQQEIERIEQLREGRDIAALELLPTMADAPTRLVMGLLTELWSAAFIVGDAPLARLISATMVRLSLQHGNTEESAYGYVTHAITVGPLRGDYAQAYAYGLLALAVNRRFDDARLRAKVLQQFQAHVNLWCQPFDSCAALAREACRAGLDSGDFLYAAYGAGTEPWAAMLATQDLARFERETLPAVALIESLQNPAFADSVRLLVNWSRALQGRCDGALSLSDVSFDEAAYVQRYRDNPFFTTIHAVTRLQLCSLLGTPAEALAAARHAAATVQQVPGTVWPVTFDFWHALALAATLDAHSAGARDSALARLRQAAAGFATLARHCAQNFRCQALLLAAEIARVEGRSAAAAEGYAEAVEFAAGRPLLPWRALAHELCGRALLAAAQPALARLHLAQARACYASWGARAKVETMAQQYASVLAPRRPAEPAPAAEPPPERIPALRGADGLDLDSVLKAAQALAAETELQALPERLLRIAIENAGAERGALVLETDAGLMVHAVDAAAAGGIAAEPLDDSAQVPAGIVHYVRRTGQAVVLAEAEADEQHGAEPYITRRRPRSLLCVPAHRQGRLIGVLYLEHGRIAGAFTAQRVQVLQALSTQAAISLENARRLARQAQEIDERTQAQAQLGSALAEVERLRAELEAENSYLRRDLIANVSHDLRTPLVSIRGYLEVLAAKGETLAPTQRRSHVDTALRQSEHLGTLIDELFELARLDFKGITLERERFELAELASDVLQKFRLIAQGRQIELRLDAPAAPTPVHADLSLIERVLDNLIGNALRFTPAGGHVAVALVPRGEHIGVCVSDSGSGIAAHDLPHIFERHYRARGARAGSVNGAGLGLAIARRIVELHGGEITAHSRDDSGAAFSFSLAMDMAAR
jgi:predicted ATPase/signal transduction histidine kinase